MSCYFETLSETLENFVETIQNDKGVFEDDLSDDLMFFPPVHYGQTVSKSFPLKSLKGKSTKKYAHLSIYRLETGRYELTSYIS